MRNRKPVEIINVRPADANNQVLTIKGGSGAYRKKPCSGCPWVKENTGDFPAEAFRHSAGTAYDAAFNTFGCHESGTKSPTTCAGFLLKNAYNNVGQRLKGGVPLDVKPDGRELHESYRAMAVANGVDPEDPVLAPCRANDGTYT
jgi:hypothetical protein